MELRGKHIAQISHNNRGQLLSLNPYKFIGEAGSANVAHDFLHGIVSSTTDFICQLHLPPNVHYPIPGEPMLTDLGLMNSGIAAINFL